jgi:transcriptional regulator with XRE-family HTH domain
MTEKSAQSHHRQRSNTPFVSELPRLLHERGISPTTVARKAGVSPSHLSRVLRGIDYKTPSAELTEKIARALDLSPDYFPEYREGTVVTHVKSQPAFRDRLFDEITAGRRHLGG